MKKQRKGLAAKGILYSHSRSLKSSSQQIIRCACKTSPANDRPTWTKIWKCSWAYPLLSHPPFWCSNVGRIVQVNEHSTYQNWIGYLISVQCGLRSLNSTAYLVRRLVDIEYNLHELTHDGKVNKVNIMSTHGVQVYTTRGYLRSFRFAV